MEFPARIARWRTIHSATQKEAAALFGIPPRTWQGWEQGRGCPVADLITRLLAYSPAQLKQLLQR